MAELRVELLLVFFTGTLLRGSVQAWELIKDSDLSFYQTGQWSESQSVPSPDDSSDFDNSENEDGGSQFEGVATVGNADPFTPHGFEVDTGDFDETSFTPGPDGEFQVEFVEAPPRTWSGSTSLGSNVNVICTKSGFQITLPAQSPLSSVKVWGSNDLLPVMEAPASCGYEVNLAENKLYIPFTGCNVKSTADCHTRNYSLQLLYMTSELKVASATCEAKPGFGPRAPGQPSNCVGPTIAPSKAKNCAVAVAERIPCGQAGISSSDCEKMGCCADSSACYYPMDECTADQHFVFAIRDNSGSVPVDPTKVVIPGNPNCKPVIVNDKVAIFKFKVTECGARSYTVGETNIYMAEVQTVVEALNLKYGVITRSDPLRFMVECRYSKSGSVQQSLASVGVMVKTPASTLPATITSDGLYGVQLRIAKDKTYSSYLPSNSQPLRLLLGAPVYLELRLLSPKPDAVILVNYCIAYPRSANNALVLVYEGCANPNDPNVSILKVSDLPKNRHQRRFVVKAFQFMEQKTNKYLDEEIYFMCSSEVCMPKEKTCVERCFDGKSP